MEKNTVNGILETFAIYCNSYAICFHKSLTFFRASIASLDPETVELPPFSILSAMFTGGSGPPEKLSLAPGFGTTPENVLCMIVKI